MSNELEMSFGNPTITKGSLELLKNNRIISNTENDRVNRGN